MKLVKKIDGKKTYIVAIATALTPLAIILLAQIGVALPEPVTTAVLVAGISAIAIFLRRAVAKLEEKLED